MQRGKRIQNIVSGDGTVNRLFFCDCGTGIYRKNLSTGQISVLGPSDRGLRRETGIEVPGNPSQIIISCSRCGMKHKLVGISEETVITDDVASSEDVIE
jgi:hypothetical protein